MVRRQLEADLATARAECQVWKRKVEEGERGRRDVRLGRGVGGGLRMSLPVSEPFEGGRHTYGHGCISICACISVYVPVFMYV